MKILSDNIIVDILAIYGALLSTGVLILDIIRYRNNRIIIRIYHDFVFTSERSHSPQKLLQIKAANIGKRPVTLNSCGLELPDKSRVQQLQQFFFQEDAFPKRLQENESFRQYYDLDDLIKQLGMDLKIIPYFTDITNKKYYGESLKLGEIGFKKSRAG